jgi:hypothetical protein
VKSIRGYNLDLLPCTCGGVPEITTARGEDSVTTYVYCPKCNRQEEMFEDVWSARPDVAVHDWNALITKEKGL